MSNNKLENNMGNCLDCNVKEKVMERIKKEKLSSQEENVFLLEKFRMRLFIAVLVLIAGVVFYVFLF